MSIRRANGLALLLTLIVGLGRISLTPLWANPEEPYHFIRLRMLIFERDPQALHRLEQQIRESTLVADESLGLIGAWSNTHFDSARAEGRFDASGLPDIPRILGTTQFDEPTLYYLLIAPSQLLVNRAGLDAQLIAARLGTLIIGLLVIGLTIWLTTLIFPDKPSLRVGLPVLVVMLPAFTKIMTMVNNTALAVLAVTLALLALAFTLRSSNHAAKVVMLTAAALICATSKSTAFVGVLLVLWACLWLVRQWLTTRALAIAAVFVLIISVLVIGPVGARNWYLPQTLSGLVDANAPDGRRFVQIPPAKIIWQSLPLDQVEAVSGSSANLSLWLRGSASSQVWVTYQDEPFVQLSNVDTHADDWTRITLPADIPSGVRCVVIRIENTGTNPAYIDQVSLVRSGSQQNLLANGSFEAVWITIRPQIEALLPNQLAERSLKLSLRIASLTEVIRQRSLFATAIRYIFTTFWGWYGWIVPSLSVPTIALLAVSFPLSAAGLVRGFRRGDFSPEQRWFLLGCLIVSVSAALLAFASLEPSISLPRCDRYQGRVMPAPYYLAPASVPLITLWVCGLQAWVPAAHRAKLIGGLSLALYVAGLLALVNAELPAYLQALGVAP